MKQLKAQYNNRCRNTELTTELSVMISNNNHVRCPISPIQLLNLIAHALNNSKAQDCASAAEVSRVAVSRQLLRSMKQEDFWPTSADFLPIEEHSGPLQSPNPRMDGVCLPSWLRKEFRKSTIALLEAEIRVESCRLTLQQSAGLE